MCAIWPVKDNIFTEDDFSSARVTENQPITNRVRVLDEYQMGTVLDQLATIIDQPPTVINQPVIDQLS